jgi:hypothetical protein
MRGCLLSLGLSVALFVPKTGSAQVYEFRSPPPAIDAAAAAWQVDSQLMLFAGLAYAPTREFRLFDAQVMTQIGVFKGVPIYADTTLEPWSVVYVPVGRARMRTYSRVREVAEDARVATDAITVAGAGAIGTASMVVPAAPRETVPDAVVDRVAPRPAPVERSRTPRPTDGVWLEFQGRRWYSDGEAASYSPERFIPIGDYHGFLVYRDKTNKQGNVIWVASVEDGPLAPYVKR